MKRFILSSLGLLALALQSTAQQAGLSPFTRQYLHAAQSGAKTADPQPGYVYKQSSDGSLLLSAFLQVTPSFSEESLAPLGVRVGTKAGQIWTAQIPPASLQSLTRLPGLRYIQLDEPVVPMMDSARRVTRVDSVHRGLNLPQIFNGQGVVVGIIDAGFDYRHPVLFDTTGVGFRVRKVWEQKVAGTPPTGYAYGREMTDSNAMWTTGTDLINQSHGAHVAGIAAGSGAGGPGGSSLYRGVAYKSDLVLVGITPSPQNWTSTGMTDIIDGMNYIFNYAASVGKPAVANLSWGCTIGSLDGRSLFSQACDALVGTGKIFCLSAMNNGNKNIHLAKTFTATDSTVRTFVTLPVAPSGKRTWVDVWGDTAQSLCVRLSLYNAGVAVDSTAQICLSNTTNTLRLIGSDGDTLFATITTETASFNGKPRIFLNLRNKSANAVMLSLRGGVGSADAWMGFVEGTIGYYGSFTAAGSGSVAGNTDMTISDMASTKSAIAVAAFTSKRNFINVSGTQLAAAGTQNAIAPFSSKGPTADGRVKPDIAGPGLVVASAVSSYDSTQMPSGAGYQGVVHNYTNPVNGRTYPYAAFGGTSMSSPAVAGIVALMLQAAPGLTPAQVRDILAETAMRDANTGTYPAGISSNTWGAGKVNAYRAMKRVLEIAAGVQDVGVPTLSCLLFPNPGRGHFSLEVENGESGVLQVSVQDVQGREMKRETWRAGAGSRVKTFDWSSLAPGTYLVRVEGGAKSAVMKMVVR